MTAHTPARPAPTRTSAGESHTDVWSQPVAARPQVADVQHTDPAVGPALTRYIDAFHAGASILVRPKAAFDGLDAVVAAVRGLAPGSLLVTDLEEITDDHAAVVPTEADPPASATEPAWSEPLLAYHTSGSTGSPKCVIYRRSQVLSHARAVSEVLELGEEHIYAALPPMRFAYGLSIVNSHLLSRVPVTFTTTDWGLPGLAQLAAGDDRPLAIYALPQHTPLLLACDLPSDRLARLFIAGGRLSGASAAALARRFPGMRLTNMYGQAEMGPRLATWDGRPADFTEGLIGRPIPGVGLDVGEDGQLLARSDHAMSACLRPPYEAVADFAGSRQAVRTGDLGGRTADGLLRHEGRADHIVNVAGTKVDIRRVLSIVQDVARPLLVNVGSRPTRTGGDAVPVIEMVPDGPAPRSTTPIRRALHGEFGSLAALFDLKYVDRLTLKESGK